VWSSFQLAGRFASTRERFGASSGFPILVLHDTTEFSFRREDGRAVGILQKAATRYASQGCPRLYLAKNANRMFACFALVNLYIARKRLVPLGA